MTAIFKISAIYLRPITNWHSIAFSDSLTDMGCALCCLPSDFKTKSILKHKMRREKLPYAFIFLQNEFCGTGGYGINSVVLGTE